MLNFKISWSQCPRTNILGSGRSPKLHLNPPSETFGFAFVSSHVYYNPVVERPNSNCQFLCLPGFFFITACDGDILRLM